jgi:DNA-cytosine methyltransferase
MGDVTQWRNWDIDWASIGLVTGGFPCQAWSMAGKQLGDKDERGMLFWVMLDIIKHVKHFNPNVNFMIENVKMKKEFEEYITMHTESALGEVHKILINSALVSAQNRNRYYWTSFPVDQPEDKGILLTDILDVDPGDGFLLSDKGINRIKKYKNSEVMLGDNDKALCLVAGYSKLGRDNTFIKCGRMVGRKINPETGRRDDYNPDLKTVQRLETRIDNKSGCLTTVQKDNQIVIREKSKTVRASGRGSYDRHEWDSISNCHYRKLTPTECERLQTVPDNYTNHVSNSQRYKMLGNGWTVDVIAHIFKNLK